MVGALLQWTVLHSRVKFKTWQRCSSVRGHIRTEEQASVLLSKGREGSAGSQLGTVRSVFTAGPGLNAGRSVTARSRTAVRAFRCTNRFAAVINHHSAGCKLTCCTACATSLSHTLARHYVRGARGIPLSHYPRAHVGSRQAAGQVCDPSRAADKKASHSCHIPYPAQLARHTVTGCILS